MRVVVVVVVVVKKRVGGSIDRYHGLASLPSVAGWLH